MLGRQKQARLQRRVRRHSLRAGVFQPGPRRGHSGDEVPQLAKVPQRLLQRALRYRGVTRRTGLAVGLLSVSQSRRRLPDGVRGVLAALVELVRPVRDGDGGQGGVLGAQVLLSLLRGVGAAGSLVSLSAQFLQAGRGIARRCLGLAGQRGQPRGVILQGGKPCHVPVTLGTPLASELQRRSLRAAGQRLP